RGNWIGEAPYKTGRPCSECPPSYGGGCQNNLCYKDYRYQDPIIAETDETNEVEISQEQKPVRFYPPEPRANKPIKPKKITPETYMTQVITCETKMRDKCRGSTCNRYLCPAGCLYSKGKIFGTFYYESSSSICRAAIHYGILDNKGGLVDITRKGRTPGFVKSTRNGVESFRKSKPSNAFMVSKVTTQTLDCYTTVAELCHFKKPVSHCPRIYCPAHCKDEPSYWAPVFGTNVYADSSSICKAAVHAGVIPDERGGFVDVMPVEKKKTYIGSLKNGVQSESLKNPSDGNAFRIFAVKQ
ncbi:CRLD2 protein, partial [Oreotrochilus melanogaster]|nr:CRLD2 protein [Oreotrochilus melanogaster]